MNNLSFQLAIPWHAAQDTRSGTAQRTPVAPRPSDAAAALLLTRRNQQGRNYQRQ